MNGEYRLIMLTAIINIAEFALEAQKNADSWYSMYMSGKAENESLLKELFQQKELTEELQKRLDQLVATSFPEE